MHFIKLIIIFAVVQALAFINGPVMTGEMEPDPISAADIEQTEDSVILPMDVLRVTEAVTPEGISHTMEYIEKTRKDEMKKREPLSVVARGDGTYCIIDGNQSYSALKYEKGDVGYDQQQHKRLHTFRSE